MNSEQMPSELASTRRDYRLVIMKAQANYDATRSRKLLRSRKRKLNQLFEVTTFDGRNGSRLSSDAYLSQLKAFQHENDLQL